MLIDTHAHLAHGRLVQDIDAVLDRARQGGVDRVIIAVGDLHESKTALNLARKHDGCFCLAGIHPHEAKDAPDNAQAQLEDLLGMPRCVALGEIGLDYHYDFSPRPQQQRVFAEQLAVAARLACPVVIHTREAFDDTLAVLVDSGLAGERIIFHSFTGDAQAARRVLDIGASISFSGIATFKNAGDVREGVKLTPADRILVETDAPYLSPEPVRKVKTNEPANVVHVAQRLAEVRGEPFETFAAQTTANAERLFKLQKR